jgi:perosamine synthetase
LNLEKIKSAPSTREIDITNMNIPYHRPILPSDIHDVFPKSIQSGWLTTGPQVEKYENALKAYLGSDHVVAVNSCTGALHLALAAKGFGPGEKFIVPTNTFVASAAVGEWLGMEPILIDCDPNSHNFDLNRVEKALTQNANIKAIVPVHVAGEPVDMKVIFEWAEKYNLFVIEDAAHALEAESTAGKIGNTNHAAAFSFYANKNITTGGEGGALSTNDEQLAYDVKHLSIHGLSKDGWERYSAKNGWRYEITQLGYKYNMTDISGAFGITQLTHVDEWHKKRFQIIQKFKSGFDKINGLTLPSFNIHGKHGYHLYIVQFKEDLWRISRDEFIKKVNKSGIGTSVHYVPLHLHSYYQKTYGYTNGDFPVATALSNRIISLPLYPDLKDEEVEYIIHTLNQLWTQYSL